MPAPAIRKGDRIRLKTRTAFGFKGYAIALNDCFDNDPNAIVEFRPERCDDPHYLGVACRFQVARCTTTTTMTKATKRRTTLLTDDELYDLHMALDVLCGCYGSGVDVPEVQTLLKRYAGGTPDGTRARALFNQLWKIARVRIDSL